MDNIPSWQQQVLYQPPHWITFESLLNIAEKQKSQECRFQQRINQLNAKYYFVSCNNKATKIRVTINDTEKYKYNLYRTTEEYLSNYNGSYKYF